MKHYRKEDKQKVTISLYSIKRNGEKELFGTWSIYIGKKYIIGRGKDSDISIDSLLLSRKQIEIIYYSSNLISVKDLGSRNGTFVNNVKITPFQEIKCTSKDRLSFGNENNVVEFRENVEKRKSIFDDAENRKSIFDDVEKRKSIFDDFAVKENRNTNINNFRNSEQNQDEIKRERETQFKTRPYSNPKRNQKYLNISSDSVDTEIRMKNKNSKNDNNYNTSRQNQNYSRGYLNNRYRANSPLPVNYNKTNYNENDRKDYNEFNKRGTYNNYNTDNRFIGRKYGRNMTKKYNNRYNNRYGNRNNNRYDNRNDNGMKRRIYNNNRKSGIEQLKKKIENVETNNNKNEEDKKNGLEKEKFENDLIDLLNGKDNKKDKLFLKENDKNGLELVMPIKDEDLMKLKKSKKSKVLVSGYLDLELDK